MGVASAGNGAHEGCENFEKATSADSKYEKKTEKLSSENVQVELHVASLVFPGSILMMLICHGKQTIFGIFRVSASSKIASLFTNHDFMNAHKILGIFCLAHYVVRFAWLIVYGDMFFRPESWFTWILPAVHVLLSSSSFIFPVPLHRYSSLSVTTLVTP